jgi:hypothetical protein
MTITLEGMTKREGLVVLAASTMLVACASYGPGNLQPGTPITDVITRMGPPTGEYPGPNGTRRVEFARGPMGKHTYMIDVNPQGQVIKWDQVLTENNFLALPNGISEQELLYRLGHPAEVLNLPRRNEQVWSYRYDVAYCQWFQVNIDQPTKKVTASGYGLDWRCAGGGDTRPD